MVTALDMGVLFLAHPCLDGVRDPERSLAGEFFSRVVARNQPLRCPGSREVHAIEGEGGKL